MNNPFEKTFSDKKAIILNYKFREKFSKIRHNEPSLFDRTHWRKIFSQYSGEYANERMQKYIKSHIQNILQDLNKNYPNIIKEKKENEEIELFIPRYTFSKSIKNAVNSVFKSKNKKAKNNSHLKVVHRKKSA
jgi:hypothetical protein